MNELHVCTKFRGNRSRDFGFTTRQPPRKFGVKSGLSQKWLKYDNKCFLWLYVLRYPFIPTNPLLAAKSFFFLFFFLNFVRSSPKPQNSKFNFCVKLLSCKRNYFSRIFLGQLYRGLPQNGAPKNQFFERLQLECYFFCYQ